MSYQNVIVIQDQFLLQHTAWDLEFTEKKRGTEETSLVQLFEDKTVMGRYWIYSERRCDQRWRICNAI